MGKGKGAPEGWVAVVKPGRVMFELSGIPFENANPIFASSAHGATDCDTGRFNLSARDPAWF